MAAAFPKDLTIVQEDLVTLIEVKLWSVDSLKDYCRRRGYKVGGSKDELAARVYFLYNQQVPENASAAEEIQANKRDYQDIYQAGPGYIVDPARLKKWEGEKAAMSSWPQTNFVDLGVFLNKKGCSLNQEILTAYKSGKAYSLFRDNYVQELFYHSISKQHPCCYLKAQCKRSQKINETPHEAWVKVVKETGEICSAYCSCFAGLSQVCNHVAAILFKLEYVSRFELSNPSCTTGICSWDAPTLDTPVFLRLEDMKFTKPSHKKGKDAKRSSVPGSEECLQTTTRECLIENNDDEPYKSFISGLQSAAKTAVLFLPGTLNDDTGAAPEEFDVLAHARLSNSVDELVASISLDKTQRQELEISTRGQGDNAKWKRARQGRLTASNFYAIHTRVETLKSNPQTNISNLVDRLLHPVELGHLPQIKHGKALEMTAIKALVAQLKSAHKNVTFQDCGLFVDGGKPYIGASPDGLISCDCHGKLLVEVKCPSKSLTELAYLSNGKLKEKSAYFGQIQGQMMITGIRSTYFFTYASETDHILNVVHYDRSFCELMSQHLTIFYLQYMAPRLLLEPSSKQRKLV